MRTTASSEFHGLGAATEKMRSPAMFPLIVWRESALKIRYVQDFKDDAQFCALCKLCDETIKLN